MAQAGAAKMEGGVTQVTMPQLGESVTEGQISRWLKQPGDEVKKYEALVEVITDKVNAEVPSPMAGKLVEIKVGEGERGAVGLVICTLSVGGEERAAAEVAAPPAVEVSTPPTAAPSTPAPGPAPEAAPPAETVPVAPSTVAHSNGQPADRAGRASPAVRRLADEHGVDISQIHGRGPGSRGTKRDVDAFPAAAPPARCAARAPAPLPAAPSAAHAAAEP